MFQSFKLGGTTNKVSIHDSDKVSLTVTIDFP